jgi:hypothetical protein
MTVGKDSKIRKMMITDSMEPRTAALTHWLSSFLIGLCSIVPGALDFYWAFAGSKRAG